MKDTNVLDPCFEECVRLITNQLEGGTGNYYRPSVIACISAALSYSPNITLKAIINSSIFDPIPSVFTSI